MTTIAVVDANNRFVRWEEKKVVHAGRLFHRSIHAFVFDGAGRLVVQRRHRDKLTYPAHWDLSCSGHVEREDYDADATDFDADLARVYERCARRELREELGIDAGALTLLGVFAPEEGVHYEHLALYRTEHHGPFVPQDDEIEELRLVAPRDIAALTPATPTLIRFGRSSTGTP